MHNRLFWKVLLGTAALLMLTLGAFAQCVSDVPSEIPIGGAACVRVCPFENYDAIELVGDVNGPNGIPVIVLRAGCNASNTDCNVDCTPIVPPAELVLGGDPYAPDNYFGESECLYIHVYWGHDNIWWMEIFSLCEGCFCVSFDDQLPVEMRGSFQAVAGNGEVALHWATASETNNDRFEVVRDGSVKTRITGLGTSATGQSYNWIDRDVTNESEYEYELVSVDANGSRHSLGTASATPHGNTAGMVTNYALYQNYPNPFNPSTRITFDLVDAGFVTIKVYNPMGEVVTTLVNSQVGKGQHSVEFDARNLTSGLYFYSITVGDRFSATRKMLLVK